MYAMHASVTLGMNFKIDISNPEEVVAKTPQLLALYEQKLCEQTRLNEQVELLRRLVGHASAVSRGNVTNVPCLDRPSEPPHRRRAAPAQDRAVQALELAYRELGGTALGPTSLYKYMIEHRMKTPTSAAALGANLWDAWKAGRIMRAPNGVYTPLDGSGKADWDRPLTDYYYAAEQGFPIPGSWSGDDSDSGQKD
jgi:hypothetical protein